MAKKKENGTDEKTTVAFVCWYSQWEFLAEAAEAEGLTLSEYIRDRMVKVAAKELKRTPPPCLPILKGGGGRNPKLSMLAKQAGVTVAEYKKELVFKALQGL